jgi:hypothetical protein
MSKNGLLHLLNEAEHHSGVVRQEMESELWGAYSHHVDVYNGLIRRALRFRVGKDLSPLAPFAPWRGGSSSPAMAEKAKMMEVAQRFEMLVGTLRKVVGSPHALGEPAMAVVQRIMDRFHLVAHELAGATARRRAWTVASEYDVQQLMHALLLLYFDDVRPEECTPSYAGGCARLDFLIKSHHLVIETKMSRRGLADKRVGDELLVDIGRYENHPDCRTLCCFIYDPSGLLKNPRGIENDLTRKRPTGMIVRVCIRP